MSPALSAAASAQQVEYVLRLGDSALILGQRLGEWCGHAPVLEEDIALANIALDYLGQARLLLTHAGGLENRGRDEDQFAFLRDAGEFRNFTLVELPSGDPVSHGAASRDYAFTVVRNLLFSAYQCALWPALEGSADAGLAGIAAKSAKEARYHYRHSADWVVRLGDGTEESHRRVQHALERLYPYTREFFAADSLEDALAEDGIGVRGRALEPAWRAAILPVLAEAGLSAPEPSGFPAQAGREGTASTWGIFWRRCSSCNGAYPGARW